jgi:hypothetical protein
MLIEIEKSLQIFLMTVLNYDHQHIKSKWIGSLNPSIKNMVNEEKYCKKSDPSLSILRRTLICICYFTEKIS